MSQPYIPLYVGDYLRDTGMLTTEQHGAYLLLLMALWSAGGALPSDDQKLARMARCSPSRWAKIRSDVLAFFEDDGSSITHGRLTKELEKAREKSIKRAEAGTRGGRAKALKNKDAAVANATILPKHSSEPEPEEVPEANASSVDRTAKAADLVDLAKPNAGKPPKAPDPFDEFWRLFPKREGSNPREPAAKAFRRVVAKGADPGRIIAGARRLAAKHAGERTPYIPQAVTWLNQRRWEDEAGPTLVASSLAPVRPQPVDDDRWRQRLQMARERQSWNSAWGPLPGEPGSLVPDRLVTPGQRMIIDELRRAG